MTEVYSMSCQDLDCTASTWQPEPRQQRLPNMNYMQLVSPEIC